MGSLLPGDLPVPDDPLPDDPAGTTAPLLVLHESRDVEAAAELCAALRAAGHPVERHALSAAAVESDRRALPELDFALDALAARAGTPRESAVVVGLGRGGTLAFLLGCTRRVAAVVDVDGPVLHAQLSPDRPTQPLELALNFEGAFLGLFSADGPVGAEELGLLEARLRAAARPHRVAVLSDGGQSIGGAHATGYHAAPAVEIARHIHAFLAATLPDDEPSPA
jgi:dienelactone hydrolase